MRINWRSIAAVAMGLALLAMPGAGQAQESFPSRPVRIVDIDQRVPSVGQSEQIRDRRNVAILAEHAVGHDDLARCGRLAQQFLEMIEIEMTITVTPGAG